MKISLATSLHLDHGWRSDEQYPGGHLHMQDFVPVGLLCLASAVQQADLAADVRVVEVNGLINARSMLPNDARFHERLAETILAAGDELVGLMTDADSLHHTLVLAEEIKRISRKTRVCLGGPGASSLAARILECFPCVDLVVQGEAEVTFVEVVDRLGKGRGLEGVAGLAFRDRDRVVQMPARPLVESLDTLPPPAFELYDMAIGAPLYLDVGRGCPYKCSFCATAPYWERRFRMKSMDRILAEMYLVRDRYGRRHVNFSHDVFTANQPWVHGFCERLIDERPGMTWTCSTRTDLIDAPLLERMAAAGCVEIYYGIESGSPSLQKAIEKNLDLDRSLDVVRSTRAAGIRPVTGFIIGYPQETRETLAETLDRFFEFLEAGGFRAHLFTLCPFAGSPLYRRYASTLDRVAEYYELPLVPEALRKGEQLKERYRDVFCSTYRYAVPAVPAALVDASEELSPHVVVLKAIWPLLLRRYPSKLDWYQRWVAWIAARNATRRPNDGLAHQGNTWDLLDFVDEELRRLGPADDELKDLVRYERAKLQTRSLPATPVVPPVNGIDGGAVVVQRGGFELLEFQHDLRALLQGRAEDTLGARGARWVAFVKGTDADVSTMEVGQLGKAILDAVQEPIAINDLVRRIPAQPGSEAIEPVAIIRLVRQLIEFGLVTVQGADS
jgi:radical SAM superfamily enzyme YgiQ (UPF0313 family)